MFWSLYVIEYTMIRLRSDTLFCSPIQLAICIEKKCQLNEDYQDCIGSVDHIDSMSEVTSHFFPFVFNG